MEENIISSSLEEKKNELNKLKEQLLQEEIELFQQEINPIKKSIDSIIDEKYKCGFILDYKTLSEIMIKMIEEGVPRIFIPYQLYKK